MPAAGWTALPRRTAAQSAPGRSHRWPPQTPAGSRCRYWVVWQAVNGLSPGTNHAGWKGAPTQPTPTQFHAPRTVGRAGPQTHPPARSLIRSPCPSGATPVAGRVSRRRGTHPLRTSPQTRWSRWRVSRLHRMGGCTGGWGGARNGHGTKGCRSWSCVTFVHGGKQSGAGPHPDSPLAAGFQQCHTPGVAQPLP